MRRTTATLALLGILALTGCATSPAATPTAPPSTVQAAEEPTDLLDCSPLMKKALDPNLFDVSKCWTSADAPDAVATHGETVFELVPQRNGSGRKVVARNASDGKRLWTSPALESVKPGASYAPQLRDFSARGADAVAIGYGLAPEGYRVIVLDAKTGKELSRNDTKTSPKEVTWGSGAVALKSYEDAVSVLSVTGAGFKELPAMPWDTKAPPVQDTMSRAIVGNHVIYVTPDRLVLDMAAQGTAGPVLTDAAGVKLGNLPKGAGLPAAAFCGDFGLLDQKDGSAPKWVSLVDGKPVPKSGCSAADHVAAGLTTSESVGVGTMQGFISPDGKTIAVPGSGVFSTVDAKVAPFPKGFGAYGISNTRAYHPLSTYDLSTGQESKHADMTGVSGVGVLGSADGATAVFKASWGLGGAPLT